MTIRRFFSLCAFLFFGTLSAAYAQSHFFFGVAGGAMLNMPIDWEISSVSRFVDTKYHNSAFEQNEYPISPVFIFNLGYSGRIFSFQTGAEFLPNVKESFGVRENPTDPAFAAIVTYSYSMISVPMLVGISFNASFFKMGLSFGPYFSFPIGEIAKTVDGKNIFKAPYNKSTILKQSIGAGARIGLFTEFAIGNGAIVFDLGFQREIYRSDDSMLLLATTDGRVSITDNEQKLTIFSGVRATLGYKYKIMLGGGTVAAPEKKEVVISTPIRYYMVVGGQAEGPLTFNELGGLANRGLLSKDTLLWKKGMVDWAKAETFTELAPLLDGTELYGSTD